MAKIVEYELEKGKPIKEIEGKPYEVLITHSAYTLARMWEDDFIYTENNMWATVLKETEKAVLVAMCARMWWIPKRLIKKARRYEGEK